MDSAEIVRTISEVVEELKLEGFDVRLEKLLLVFPTVKVLVVVSFSTGFFMKSCISTT